ncbi:MAG: signal peptidase II [Rhodoglobus sp.]
MTNETPETSGARARPYWFIIALAILVILADQSSKWWAEAALGDGEVVELPGGFFRFVLVYNPGAAFGLGTGFTWVLAVLAGGAAVAIAWYAWRVRSWPWAIAFGLVLGGAITHFGDRVFRGEVVDFIAYGDFFVGNVADIAIVGGAIFGALLALLQVPLKRRARPKD